MTAIVPHNINQQYNLYKTTDSPSERHRIKLFDEYCAKHGQNILTVDLAEYRDALIQTGYELSSVSAIMSTVRERIRSLTKDNRFISWLGAKIRATEDLSFEQTELRVQALLRSIENNADSKYSSVKTKVIQDQVEGEKLWLNGYEQDFIDRIGQNKTEILAIRDRAIIALFFATGIRREELTNLRADDLNQVYQGEKALLVRKGKGNKQRAVVYGSLWERFVEPNVMPWLDIVDEFKSNPPLFQGFWRGYSKLRGDKLNVATVNSIVSSISFEVDGIFVSPHPHALRRTYARMLFQEYGMSVLGIQQQMGHGNERTTRDYIGILDVGFRTPSQYQAIE